VVAPGIAAGGTGGGRSPNNCAAAGDANVMAHRQATTHAHLAPDPDCPRLPPADLAMLVS
ncbi:MAG: hypothetical protein WBA29_16030, partial [Xanthobacteraceae bacterium]